MTNPFDPTFSFPPIVKPVPSIEHELARIGAAFSLSDPCPHCDAKIEVNEMTGELPKTVGITHLPGCPDYVPE